MCASQCHRLPDGKPARRQTDAKMKHIGGRIYYTEFSGNVCAWMLEEGPGTEIEMVGQSCPVLSVALDNDVVQKSSPTDISQRQKSTV